MELTEEQIKNWRKVLALSLGPYALIMPEEEVRAMQKQMQSNIDTNEIDNND